MGVPFTGSRLTREPADLTEAAYRAFRELILDGTYAPGATFPITTLADSLGCSRTPAREAARRLQQEGMLVKAPGMPPVVARLGDESIESWYALRIMIEGFGVLTTVPTLREPELLRLGSLLSQMRLASEEEDLDAWETPHREFHRVLIGSMSEVLRDVAEGISERTEWARRVRLIRGARWRDALAEHQELLELAAQGRAEETAASLSRHYRRTVEAILGDTPGTGEFSAVTGMLGIERS